MRIAVTRALFAWECLEDCPTLKTVRDFLDLLQDHKLLAALRSHRANGRNDYPVEALWGVMVLTVLLRHQSVEACLADLKRNRALREMIGIEGEDGVPPKWSVSRFQKVLGQEPHLSLMREMFCALVSRLAGVVKDLGRHVAGDSTGLAGRLARSEDGSCGLDEPTGGTKEYRDEEGNVTRVLKWFGYKLHLLVDVKHELALSYQVTSANRGDNEMIGALVAEARTNLGDDLGKGAGRIETLAYDKAADDSNVHELLSEAGIKPLVGIRSLWKGETEKMLAGHDGTSNVVYDEAGTVYCYDKTGEVPVRHAMAYIGHEKSRGTLKYRCPACHAGWKCPSDQRCNAGKKYGKTVRVKQEIDLRRFPPIPRATKTFERLYKGRTSVERTNARIKVFWGADDGNVTGPERFYATVAVVMLAHAGLATLLAKCPRWEGTLCQTRLTPIAKALSATIDN